MHCRVRRLIWAAGAILASLTLPARADLDKAQRLIDQRRYGLAYREATRCRSENIDRSELLQIWSMAKNLREAEAERRLLAFHPTPANSVLYLLVRADVLSQEPESRQKDLENALRLCVIPSQRVDVLLRLFEVTRYPQDQPYWLEAAELAAQNRLSDPLLARLSLAHVNLLCSQKRGAEGWNDLAQARRALVKSPSGETLVLQAQASLLDNLGQPTLAQEARWKAVIACPDPFWAVRQLKQISYNRSDLTQAVARHLLDQLEQVEKQARGRREWEPSYELYAFRLRSAVCQETEVGLSDWMRQAQTLIQSKSARQRLLGFSERGLVQLRHKQFSQARTDLSSALELSQANPPGPNDSLYAGARIPVLSVSLAALALADGQFLEAEKYARLAQQTASGAEDFYLRQTADQTLLSLLLKTGRLDDARSLLTEIFGQAEQAKLPYVRVTTYTNVLNTMLIADLSPVSLFNLSQALAPFRMDADTPSGWLFEEIRNDPELLAKIFKALDSWKEQAQAASSRGAEAALRGLVLACLDRPLEAIDCFTRGIEVAEGAPAIQANLGLLLSHELLGQNRRSEALTCMRQAYERVHQAGALAMPGRYRLALIGHLTHEGQMAEALSLIDQGLQTETGSERAMLVFLRGVARHDPQDLKMALKTSQDRHLKLEILFQLAEWEPQGAWLDQVQVSDLKSQLRLAQVYRQRSQTDKAYQICQQSLEQFQERYEQLPVSARVPAAHSPTLAKLLDMAVELSLELHRPEQGAHWLGVWRAMQQRPAQLSPELEPLRAELTGLRQSEDPQLQARLADTRAQFLRALTQLRQRNPEMETALSAQGSEMLALQPHLDGQTLLVQYYVAPDGLYIQSVSHDGQSLRSVRVEKARLQQLLQRWCKALQSRLPLTPEDVEASRQLYSLLVSPLREARQGHPNLWIMPSGALWSLPWETLLDEEGHYLVESSCCAYLGPSEAIVLTQPVQAAQGDWVALGNSRLTGALSELQQLKGLFPDSHILSGTEASWANLQQAARQARFLHIATHSQARPDRPGESFLELADGKLRLEQIYGLTLPPGSLVVLSSCSGAVGQKHPERDLLSLSTGFRAAGASAVVAALWPVDDEATAPFFAPFYGEILAGHSRQSGLQKAKLEMLHSQAYAHPFYWGAFTLLGDPR